MINWLVQAGLLPHDFIGQVVLLSFFHQPVNFIFLCLYIPSDIVLLSIVVHQNLRMLLLNKNIFAALESEICGLQALGRSTLTNLVHVLGLSGAMFNSHYCCLHSCWLWPDLLFLLLYVLASVLSLLLNLLNFFI